MFKLASKLLDNPKQKRQVIIYPKDKLQDINWPKGLAILEQLAQSKSPPQTRYRQIIGDDLRQDVILCPVDFDKPDASAIESCINNALSDEDNKKLDIVFINHPAWNKNSLISIYSAVGDGAYQFSENKSTKKNEPSINIDDNQISDDDWHLAIAIIEGRALYKDLGNRPGNVCTPMHFEEVAQNLAKQLPLKLSVLNEEEMRLLGMELLLAVAKGSAQPARLLKFEYQGNKDSEEHIALVGKGITFDTGGISIKPSANMEAMTMDMCGAATVFGLMHTIAKAQLPINVKGYVAAAENMPSASAYKPGDIYRAMSGKTVEIKNTDAEGRLVLADAMHYASQEHPKIMLDFATLTGACIVALGHHRAAIISNNQELASELVAQGDKVNDLAWHLPNDEAYHKLLESKVADICHIGGRSAGTITAGCFLEQFVGDNIDWAHFDIAGVAFGPHSKGRPSAKPMNLVLNYLLNNA